MRSKQETQATEEHEQTKLFQDRLVLVMCHKNSEIQVLRKLQGSMTAGFHKSVNFMFVSNFNTQKIQSGGNRTDI